MTGHSTTNSLDSCFVDGRFFTTPDSMFRHPLKPWTIHWGTWTVHGDVKKQQTSKQASKQANKQTNKQRLKSSQLSTGCILQRTRGTKHGTCSTNISKNIYCTLSIKPVIIHNYIRPWLKGFPYKIPPNVKWWTLGTLAKMMKLKGCFGIFCWSPSICWYFCSYFERLGPRCPDKLNMLSHELEKYAPQIVSLHQGLEWK